MASQLIIKPTFLLKGINPEQLARDYKNPEFLAGLNFEKSTIAPIVLMSNRGKSIQDAIYTFRNRDNFIQTVVTTNAKAYMLVGTDGCSQKGGTCFICRRTFTTGNIGIPVSAKIVEDVVIVYTLYSTDSFRCSLQLIRNLTRYGRKPQLASAEPFLKFLYSKMHPEKGPLKLPPNPLLLESNGGSLNDEEYDDPRYSYIETPNLILYPAKEQYMRLQES